MRSPRKLPRYHFDHLRMVVAEKQCSVPAGVIDVFVPINVPFSRAGRPLNINRIRFESAAVVRDAAR